MCLFVAGLFSFAAANAGDSPGVIYVYGSCNGWYYPVESNESAFENSRLFETSPGSRVYEGTITFPYVSSSISFAFNTALTPDADVTDQYYSLYNNLIAPVNQALNPVGVSGVLSTTVKDEVKFTRYSNCYYYINNSSCRTYLFSLDMNNNRLSVVPQSTVVALLNDESTPTLADADRYESVDGYKHYVEAGPVKFRFYDYFNRQWIGSPGTGYDIIDAADSYTYLNSQRGSDAFFSIKDWTGGVVSFDSYYSVELACDNLVGESCDNLYAIGSFCGWSFDSAIECVRDNSVEDCVYNVTVQPASGDCELKFTKVKSWGEIAFGYGGVTKRDNDGNIVMSMLLSGNAGNFAFSSTVEAVNIRVNVSKMELTILTDGVTVDTPIESGNNLYVSFASDSFSPWDGASDAVMSQFVKLYETADGVYSGSVYVDKGKFALNFISGLAPKGTPNTVICPSSDDRELVFGNYMAYSSAVTAKADAAGRWVCDSWEGGNVEITVDKDKTSDAVKVAFDAMSQAPSDEMFLVGQCEGWNPPIEANRKHFESWKLSHTTKGFYGSFDIAAGEAMFRFYTALDGWENSSIGCQVVDSSISYEMTNGTFKGTYVSGKGSWDFPSWVGGTMYIFINTDEKTVEFSQNPISDVGEPAEGGYTPKTGVYLYYDGQYHELTKRNSTVYQGHVYCNPGTEFRLFTRVSGYSVDEPEWAGSYALSAPSAGYTLEYDDLGVAEFDYTVNDGVTTSGANSFIADYGDGYPNCYVTVDTENRKVYIDNAKTYYLVGSLTNDEVPSYSTRSQYRNAALNRWQSGVLDVPAGDFSFSYYSLGEGRLFITERTVEFDGALAVKGDVNYGYLYNKNVIKGWKGGKLLFSFDRIVDAGKLNNITVNSGCSSQTFTETAVGSLIYKGTLAINPAADKSMYLNLGGDVYMSSGPWGTDHFIGGSFHAETGISCSNYKIFYFPEIAMATNLDVTVNLNDLTVDVTVDEADLGDVYTVCTDGVKGSMLEPVAGNGSKVYGPMYLYDNEEHKFNIAGPDGSMIVPADGADTGLSFDKYGIWRGGFSTISDSHDESTIPGWRVSALDKNGYYLTSFSVILDMANSEITVVSPNAANVYYTVTVNPGDMSFIGTYPCVDNLSEIEDGILSTTDGVVYRGSVVVDKTATMTMFYLFSGLAPVDGSVINYVVSPRDGIAPAIDLTSSETVVALSDIPNWNSLPWEVTHSAGLEKIYLEYDSFNHTLSFSKANSGVEDVAVGNRCGITAMKGCVKVETDTDMSLTIYSLQGIVVKRVDVKAGVTMIDMPAGFYIANGHKLIVR